MTDLALARPPGVQAAAHMSSTDDALLSVTEAAERLRVHPTTIYRQLGAGTFPVRAFRVGRMWRIDADAFDQWVKR